MSREQNSPFQLADSLQEADRAVEMQHTMEDNKARKIRIWNLSLQALCSPIFERSEERQKLEQYLRIQAYKDYLLESTEHDVSVNEYSQPVLGG